MKKAPFKHFSINLVKKNVKELNFILFSLVYTLTMPIHEYVTPSHACDYYLMNENHLRAHRTSFTNYIERKKRKKKV